MHEVADETEYAAYTLVNEPSQCHWRSSITVNDGDCRVVIGT